MAVRKNFAFVMPDVRVGPGLERGASLRMPLEVAFAERKDAYTRCLPWEAKEYLAIRTGDDASSALNALIGAIEGIWPIGLDDIGFCSLR